MCIIHKLAQGFGGMGDGYVCVKCGYDSYHRPINGITIPERDDLMHFNEYPFIRKFDKPVGWDIDINSWTHAYNKEGNLVSRDNV